MEDKNKLLVIIDPQVDFVTGSLMVEGGQKALDRLAKWLETTDVDFSAIMFTQDHHPENHCSFAEQGGPFPKHCVAYTEGAEIYQHVERAVSDYRKKYGCVRYVDYLYKGRDPEVEEFSALSNEGNKARFARLLKEVNIGEIWVAGLASDYCVLETLKDIISIAKDTADIVVMYNCTAAVDPNGPRQKEFISILNSPDVVGICEVQEVKR